MDFNATIDLIIRELDEAREIIDDLKKLSDAPVLEIELAKSKIKNAADVISFLKQRKEEHMLEMKEPDPVKEEPSGTIHAKKTEINRAAPKEKPATPTHSPDPVVRIEPDRKTDKRTSDTFDIEQDNERKDPGKPEIQHPDQKPFVAPIIADTFSHLANRFNEQIGEKQGDDFSYTHGRRYTNISDAIGINDRFFYIRELFEGNRENYIEAISKLEHAADISEAKEILLSYRKDKRENAASKQLLDLVKRKLTPNE